MKVLVTGGSSGIGLHISKQLSETGHQVATVYNLTEPPNFVKAFKADLSDQSGCFELIQALSAAEFVPESVVFCHGITDDQLFLKMSLDSFDTVFNTNLRSIFILTKELLKPMFKSRFGKFVFISSVVSLMGSPGQANYCATKAGLIGLCRSLVREYSSRNITFNVILPGAIETRMLKQVSAERMSEMLKATPLGRVGKPEEVASLVEFLISNNASYINGALIPVDGGLSMGM